MDGANLNDIQKTLQRTLGRIEDEVGKLLEDPDGIFNPDQLLDSLDERADDLCRVIEQMNDTLGELDNEELADLNAMADAALTRRLDNVSFPVVVNTSWDTDIPALTIPGEALFSTLDQLLRMAIDQAGHGGELQIRSHRFDDQAIVEIEVLAGEPTASNSKPTDLRYGALTEFVADLGGALEVNDDDQVLRLELRLPVGIEIN